jgi:hypothetical protein
LLACCRYRNHQLYLHRQGHPRCRDAEDEQGWSHLSRLSGCL